MDAEIKRYCVETYRGFYKSEYSRLLSEISDAEGAVLNDERLNRIEAAAQKYAIKQSIIHGMRAYPNHVSLLWHSIYEAHVYRKSGVDDLKIIREVVSADQSWKKSSGHAFEEVMSSPEKC